MPLSTDAEASVLIQFGDFLIDPQLNCVTSQAQVTSLPPLSMQVLVYLIEQAPNVVSSADLLDTIWRGRVVEEGLINRRISQIRKVLGDDPRQARYIETVQRRGYRIVAPVRMLHSPTRRQGLSIAVLPFTAMSYGEEIRLGALAVTEDIIDELAALPGIEVASRTASSLASSIDSLIGIAESLNVAYLLEGSIRQSKSGVRIVAQLIRSIDGFHVWSKAFDDASGDSGVEPNVPQLVARLCLSEMRSDDYRQRSREDPQLSGIDPVAREHFLEARNQRRLIRLGQGGNWTLCLASLKQAVEVDPHFSRAYIDLASLYSDRLSIVPRSQASALAHDAINKAIALEPDSVGALMILGKIQLSLDLDYEAASSTFTTILNKDSKSKWSYFYLARIAIRAGKKDDALQFLETAASIDKGDNEAVFLRLYSTMLRQVGEPELSLTICERGLKLAAGGLDRAGLLRCKAVTLVGLGRAGEARSFIDEAWALDGHSEPEQYLSIFASIGDKKRIRSLLEKLGDKEIDPHLRVFAYLGLEEFDKAFDWIRQCIEESNEIIFGSLRGPMFGPVIRRDPRYGQMVRLLELKENPAVTPE